ncbi:MAG: hypothetical protein QM767_08355 [Anaeromyxobacter sp.]
MTRAEADVAAAEKATVDAQGVEKALHEQVAEAAYKSLSAESLDPLREKLAQATAALATFRSRERQAHRALAQAQDVLGHVERYRKFYDRKMAAMKRIAEFDSAIAIMVGEFRERINAKLAERQAVVAEADKALAEVPVHVRIVVEGIPYPASARSWAPVLDALASASGVH